jgi:hypothetical protein
MSLPRPVVPGRFYLITRRCTQRLYLLRPDDETNNAFTYCLGVAALRFGIDVLLPCAMSNHHHTVIYDRLGTYPQFIEHFHKLLARCLNALRGRRENFWASQQTSVVELVGAEDVIAKLVYVAINPVKAHLVERAAHWPGVHGLDALVTGRPLRAKRPTYFRRGGRMPAEVTLPLAIPPELGLDPKQVLRIVEAEVSSKEAQLALIRKRTRRRVVGRRNVLRTAWDARPSTDSISGGLNPTFAARDPIERAAVLARKREFIQAYDAARAHLPTKEPRPFPFGTYWLKRFVGVTVAPPPS